MVVCSCKHRQSSLGFHHCPVIRSFDRRNTLYCTITHVSVCTSVHNTGCISVFTSKGTSVSSVVTAQEGITIFSNKSNLPLFYEDVHITSVTTDCTYLYICHWYHEWSIVQSILQVYCLISESYRYMYIVLRDFIWGPGGTQEVLGGHQVCTSVLPPTQRSNLVLMSRTYRNKEHDLKTKWPVKICHPWSLVRSAFDGLTFRC